MDTKYLNYSFAPVPSPLQKPLAIELYNDTYFNDSPSIIDKTTNLPASTIDAVAFQPHLPPKPTTVAIPPPTSPTIPTPSHSHPFHASILKSTDKLFFIKFTPQNTLRPRWYLVAVDLDSTFRTCPNHLSDFTYWCIF